MGEMRWPERTRLQFIVDTLEAKRFINRSELMLKFGISEATASGDFANYMKFYPGRIEYNKSLRRYELKAETSK